MNPQESVMEQKCFMRTVSAFQQYTALASKFLAKRRADWTQALPPAHQQLLQYAMMTRAGDDDDDEDDDAKSAAPQNGNNDNTTAAVASKATSDAAAIKFPHFDLQAHCVKENQRFLSRVASNAINDLFDDYFAHPSVREAHQQGRQPQQPLQLPRPKNSGSPSAMDQDKVFSTLRQIVRDWAKEGESEREDVFNFFFDALEKQYPFPASAAAAASDAAKKKEKKNPQALKSRGHIQVMVPGGGLSRLTVELAARGFSARGNEFSYHMLITGHYIMNKIYDANSVTIFPYCDQSINNWSREQQFRAVTFPDKSALGMFEEAREQHGIEHGDLSMVAGDFVEVFSKPEEKGAWHACASCFFLDTAHNIIEYLKVIHDALVPGGLLINVGPMLFHWADSLNDVSIEITYEELKRLMYAMGFELVHEQAIQTAYAQNTGAMKQHFYRCPAFVARKVEPKLALSGGAAAWQKKAEYGAVESEVKQASTNAAASVPAAGNNGAQQQPPQQQQQWVPLGDASISNSATINANQKKNNNHRRRHRGGGGGGSHNNASGAAKN